MSTRGLILTDTDLAEIQARHDRAEATLAQMPTLRLMQSDYAVQAAADRLRLLDSHRRLVACLAGVPTAELEAGVVGEMRALAAAVVANYDSHGDAYGRQVLRTLHDRARALLARLTPTPADAPGAGGAGGMSVRIFFDPFRLVIDSAEALWPQIDAEVVFNPEVEARAGGEACGVTAFPEDGGTPEVVISSNLPYAAAVEILAHELAHVAVGPDAEHGPEWEAAFAAIHAEYERRLEGQAGGRIVTARAAAAAGARGSTSRPG